MVQFYQAEELEDKPTRIKGKGIGRKLRIKSAINLGI